MTVRILYLDHAPFMGGAQIVLLNLVHSLPAGGWSPIVATCEHSPLRLALQGTAIPVLPVAFDRLNQAGPALPFRWLRASVSIARLARRERASLLHSNTVRAHLAGSLAAWLARIPIVWTLHDNTLPRRAARVLSRRPARVITVSEWLKQYYASAGLVEKSVVIPNGLAAAGPGTDGGALRVELGVPADAPLVVNVGRLVAGKAPHVFVEAAALVAAEVPQAFFALVGGPDTPEPGQPPETYASAVLAQALRASGLEQRLMVTGHRADAARFFSAADVVVYTSAQPEGLPTVILEAMQAGKPVVASAIGGALEIVLDGVTGRLVPPGDAAALASGILECLRQPERAQDWGRSGQARLETHFSLQGQARQTEAVYRSVLRDARSTAA